MVKVNYDHVQLFLFNKTFFEEVSFSSASQHVHSSEDCLDLVVSYMVLQWVFSLTQVTMVALNLI